MKKLSPWPGLLLCAAIVACTSPPPKNEEVTPAHSTGGEVSEWTQGQAYRVIAERSDLRLIVHPEGPMAALGHVHVVGGPAIDGKILVAEPFEESALRLTIEVSELAVDRPERRDAEGLDPIDPKAARDTRKNMLSPQVLDAEAHPTIQVESIAISGARERPEILTRITLAGRSRELSVPVSLEFADGELRASARFIIRQSDFGLDPFSAVGGTLRVSDKVRIRFRIIATRQD